MLFVLHILAGTNVAVQYLLMRLLAKKQKLIKANRAEQQAASSTITACIKVI